MSSDSIEVYSQECSIHVSLRFQAHQELAILEGSLAAAFAAQYVYVLDEALCKDLVQVFVLQVQANLRDEEVVMGVVAFVGERVHGLEVEGPGLLKGKQASF